MFLGFTLTSRNIQYKDRETKRNKIGRYYIADKAHYSSLYILPSYASDIIQHKSNPKKLYVTSPVKEIQLPSIIEKNIISPATATITNIKVLNNDMHISPSSYGEVKTYEITIKGFNDYLGFRFIKNDKDEVILNDIMLRTPANRIPRWRTTLKFYTLLKINNTPIKSIDNVYILIKNEREKKNKMITFTFVLHEKTEAVSESLISQLTFDQFKTVKYQYEAVIE